MSALIMFPTLMLAQRGERLLSQEAIPASVVKAPRNTEKNGCAYALRLSQNRLERALRLLENRKLPHGRVFLRRGDGDWEEAEG